MMRTDSAKRALNAEEINSLKLAREMEDLLRTPGWKAYAKLLEHHVHQKLQQSSAVCKNLDEAIEQNSHKGAVLGLRLALDLPKGIIAVAEQIKSTLGDGE
jgi:hypothetical protein